MISKSGSGARLFKAFAEAFAKGGVISRVGACDGDDSSEMGISTSMVPTL